MSKFRRFLSAAAGVATLALAGCSGEPSASTEAAANEILVGEYGSMTGSEATFGQSTHNGIQLAVNEINAAGGINGKQIKLISYDDQGKPQEAGTAVTRLINEDHVVAVLGEVSSGLSLAGGRVAQQYGVPMISPSSTNPAVTEIGDMVSRVCFLDSFQGDAVARFSVDDLHAKKAAILFAQDSPYSKGLAEFFEASFAKDGREVLKQAYTSGDADYASQLTSMREFNPDVIFVPGYYTEGGNIAIQARKLGIAAPLIGGDGWDSSQLAAIGKDAIEGAYYSNHYSHQEDRAAVKKFVEAYKTANKGENPDGLAALGYDAAGLLFDAMKRSPSLAGKDLAKAIAETKQYPGVTGDISMDANRDAVKPAVIVKMQGGEPVYVKRIYPAGMEPAAPAAPVEPAAPAAPAEGTAPAEKPATP
jgi:branched-chain amino acid transport system substrate-binding protein